MGGGGMKIYPPNGGRCWHRLARFHLLSARFFGPRGSSSTGRFLCRVRQGRRDMDGWILKERISGTCPFCLFFGKKFQELVGSCTWHLMRCIKFGLKKSSWYRRWRWCVSKGDPKTFGISTESSEYNPNPSFIACGALHACWCAAKTSFSIDFGARTYIPSRDLYQCNWNILKQPFTTFAVSNLFHISHTCYFIHFHLTFWLIFFKRVAPRTL